MKLLTPVLATLITSINADTASIIASVFTAINDISDTAGLMNSNGTVSIKTCASVLEAAKIVSTVANSTDNKQFQAIAAQISTELMATSRNTAFMTACEQTAVQANDTASAAVFAKQVQLAGANGINSAAVSTYGGTGGLGAVVGVVAIVAVGMTLL